ncbi:TPA: hypothetical protein I8393_000350 [Serratia marcescens]|uniref:hypothetical protein n=2 Tax=Serratia TaxID=613 RepID=UPI0012B553AF|nr:hypothetical protein [Serratia marcescens]MBH3044901.1 hypothetical protein [Serratia marcescens]MBH3146499.1 hypothetical protein [Serratia marcescens]MBI6146455.1 hypothetical protein [Serratia marcescens]MDP8620808.1 hypothetical protein [Serratia marcescens]HAT2904940.1 hypothetical protein [Serratia marcescens]
MKRNIQLTIQSFKEQTPVYGRLITNNTWMKVRQAPQNDVTNLTTALPLNGGKMREKGGGKVFEITLSVFFEQQHEIYAT